ncbi:hypothetical protein AB0M46_40640 [Dactylosporangium sp. NPDC051485]|uniref:hypothetical protein n=1 Tax=Dactylosporangium sp. NPDC051485 TaxID=3154846 RepID=UPI003445B029
MTTDTQAVIARIPRFALAADRRQMTLWDLAEALSAPLGNIAEIWDPPVVDPSPATGPPTTDSGTVGAAPPASVSGAPPYLRFDRETRAMLEQALRVALRERAEHIGTEHLLAALVRTGPPEVVTWLAARGATAEAVDALLARLHGGPGVERVPAEWSRADRRNRLLAAAIPRLLVTVVVVLAVMVMFVLCVWGP